MDVKGKTITVTPLRLGSLGIMFPKLKAKNVYVKWEMLYGLHSQWTNRAVSFPLYGSLGNDIYTLTTISKTVTHGNAYTFEYTVTDGRELETIFVRDNGGGDGYRNEQRPLSLSITFNDIEYVD